MMKKLLLVLVCVALASVLFVGCIPGLNPWADDEDEVPVPEMEANVSGVLYTRHTIVEEVVDEEIIYVTVDTYHVAWSIENVGELFIREYEITFDVFYPMVSTKDNVVFTLTGNYLEVEGEGKISKHEGLLDLVAYDTPETVDVSWELFN